MPLSCLSNIFLLKFKLHISTILFSNTIFNFDSWSMGAFLVLTINLQSYEVNFSTAQKPHYHVL